ncbi:MAG TPA: outer membrane protein assembly factor BamA [Candidatus Acidoferrales bacterium]|nr:outer membrane protein assembly factor BamA [Candidatus Acidoferrales bacterium]
MSQTVAASGKTFLRVSQILALVCLVTPLVAPMCAAQQQSSGTQSVITRIDFVGERRIQRDTMMARIFSRAGDPYNPDAIHRDFIALWNTGWFSDIEVRVENDPKQPNGKIVVFYVTERPVIRKIEYIGEKSVTESDILDAYKKTHVDLLVENRFDPTVVKKASEVIKALLGAHGHQFATVKPTYEMSKAQDSVKLVFHIDEGPKVKVGKITFSGNHVFSDRRLLFSMKDVRPYGVPLGFAYIPVLSKTYNEDRLYEDLQTGITELYQDHGYMKVNADVASQKTVDVIRAGIPGPWPLVGKEHGKATNIAIKIEEGPQYRMGKLILRSSDPDQGLVFSQAVLERTFPLKTGDIFDRSKVTKAVHDYGDLYGLLGYIDFVATPMPELDDANKVVNLTMSFAPGTQYFVRRITFSGNTTTRDKVIRRELLLDEGQVFDRHRWELSILRLNQLGYFEDLKPEEAGDIKRNPKTGTVDINLKVKEKNKQSISFTGGVSGIAGSFLGLSYQTNNFLGLGETLTASAQVGDIQTNIVFGFTEPYLFDRPLSTGFTIFASKFDYNTARQEGLLLGQQVAINPALQENYNQDQKGFTLNASYPPKKHPFERWGLTYQWSTSNITAFSQSAQLLFELTQFRSLAGPSALKGIHSSKIIPTFTYDTVNNPVNPTKGTEFVYSMGLEGGPLRGNTNSFSNTAVFEYFRPNFHKRNVIAFRVQAADITGYGGVDVAPYSRFYLGGESDVRGYNYFTISPFAVIPSLTSVPVAYLDPTRLNNGSPTPVTLQIPMLQYVPTRPGGDFQTVSNLEYRIPLIGPHLEMDFFNDFAINGALRPSQLKLDPSALAQLQQEFPNAQFPNTVIPSHLQLISGTNFTPHTSAGIQFLIQLPIVQAPFRIYYAYNYLRLRDTISAPPGAWYLSPAQMAALPPGVYQTEILPQLQQVIQEQTQRIPASLLEPKSVFQFTVSRTF